MVSWHCKKTQPQNALFLWQEGLGQHSAAGITSVEVSPFCLWADFGLSCVGKLCSLSLGAGGQVRAGFTVYQVGSGLVLNIGKW